MSSWRWLIMSLALAGCDPGIATLIVQVRTDLTPEIELASVRVRVEPAGGGEPVLAGVDVSSDLDWALGVRVAELAELPLGRTMLRVDALDASDIVLVGRPVRIELEGGVRVVTVLLSRDCAGVECPLAGGDASAAACLEGVCVPPECTEDTPEACPPGCNDDTECPASPFTCVTATCTPSGACFEVPNMGVCTGGATCTVDRGCVGGATACMTDMMCAADEICATIFRQSTCREACMGDTCAAGESCISEGGGGPGFVCAGDPCDPVASTGCPGGVCDVIHRPDTAGTFGPTPICRPSGTVADRDLCVSGEECATSAGCYAYQVEGSCTPWCRTDADCGGTTCIGRDTGRAEPYGFCSAGCDPFAHTGCPTGRSCLMVTREPVDAGPDVWVSFCSAAGTAAPFGFCDVTRDCDPGLTCIANACEPICEMGGAICPSSYTCTSLVPTARIGGVELGTCQ